jgi:signal transduction histidine kinase
MLPETTDQLWAPWLIFTALAVLTAWLAVQMLRGRRSAEQHGGEIRKLQAALDEMQHERDDLKASYAKLRAEREALQRDSAAVARQIAALRGQLDEAEQAVAEASKMKSQFVANMSHELRTPLNGILGLAHSLLDSDLQGHQRHEVELIHLAGEDLMRVVNDVLDLSKLEASRMELESIPFHLGELLEGVFSLLYPQASRKRLSYSLTYGPAMERHYLGDPFRIRQVVLNLLGNAIKFTHAGFVYLDVEEEGIEGEAHWLKVCISDSGVGIDVEKQRMVFEEFQQADPSTTRRFGGTGLGLSLSRRIVDLMGGQIELSSEPGKGSRFYVRLPLQSAAENEHDREPPPSWPKASLGGNLEGLRLLVQHRHLPEMLALERLLESLPGVELDLVSQSAELVQRLGDETQPSWDAVITCASALAVWEDELVQRFVADGVAPPELIVLQSMEGEPSFPLPALPGIAALRPPVLPSQCIRILGNLRPGPVGPLFEAAGITAAELRGTRVAERTNEGLLLIAHDSPVELMRLQGIATKIGIRAKTAASGKEFVGLLEQYPTGTAIVQAAMLSSEVFLSLWRAGAQRGSAMRVLVTGTIDPAARLQLGAGPVDYVLLPESPRLAQVRDALQAAKRMSASAGS